ncbi:hypothetical protein LINPERHAP2_LOCUS14250, partial [Linum perenne]
MMLIALRWRKRKSSEEGHACGGARRTLKKRVFKFPVFVKVFKCGQVLSDHKIVYFAYHKLLNPEVTKSITIVRYSPIFEEKERPMTTSLWQRVHLPFLYLSPLDYDGYE